MVSPPKFTNFKLHPGDSVGFLTHAYKAYDSTQYRTVSSIYALYLSHVARVSPRIVRHAVFEAERSEYIYPLSLHAPG